MTEQEFNEMKEGLMTEEDVHDKYDLWLSKLSRFIISRSSRLVSSDTQKDGRTLLLLSALSSFFYIGIIKFEEYSSSGIKFSFSNGGAFIPLIIEIVCLYFAISFFIDAYSELKIWQFKTLIKDSDDENPLKALDREKDVFKIRGEEILEKYKGMIEKATEEHEVDAPAELRPETKDLNQIREYSRKMEERMEKQKQLMEVCDMYYAAQDIELKQLEAEREIWNFKMKSFKLEILPVVKVYKFKHFVNIVFPLAAFVISIASLAFYLLRHR